jgi:hypothetical protein
MWRCIWDRDSNSRTVSSTFTLFLFIVGINDIKCNPILHTGLLFRIQCALFGSSENVSLSNALYMYIAFGDFLWNLITCISLFLFSLIHMPGIYLHAVCMISLRVQISSSATRGISLSPLSFILLSWWLRYLSWTIYHCVFLTLFINVYCCYRHGSIEVYYLMFEIG